MKVFLAGRIAVEAEGVVIDESHFPGRQGRLLFAYLVAEHRRAVPRDELADVLWGDAPPATWDKALSVLVSKLRGLLAESGVDGASALTASFGCYRLELPEGTWVDVLAAEKAGEDAERFLESGELESAAASATVAESLARNPFLPGDDGPWIDAKRRELAEVRARALNTLAAASLRTDKPVEAVRWAELAIEAEPFRESGYRRLMEAHVAAGNRAEALQVYERCRRLLADELGAYPSPETETVYRGLLESPSHRAAEETGIPTPLPRRRRPARAAATFVGLVAVVAAGAAIAIVATRGDGSGAPSAAGMPRIALVVPRSPPGTQDPTTAQYVAALEQARSADDVHTKTFAIDLSRPGLPQIVSRTIGSYNLVILAGPPVSARFTNVMARHPHTRFAVIDPPNNEDAPLNNAVTRDANATDVFFSTGPAAFLAGYLGALMAERRDPGKPVVSMIVSDDALNENEISGFEAGAEAVRGTIILVRSANDATDQSVCQRIADHQISGGSTVVYAVAGDCSVGALSAADLRGVWGIGSDQGVSGRHILADAVKRIGQATDYVIGSYLDGTLPRHHLDIGIERNAVAIVNINAAVPDSIRAKLSQERQANMSGWKQFESPLPVK